VKSPRIHSLNVTAASNIKHTRPQTRRRAICDSPEPMRKHAALGAILLAGEHRLCFQRSSWNRIACIALAFAIPAARFLGAGRPSESLRAGMARYWSPQRLSAQVVVSTIYRMPLFLALLHCSVSRWEMMMVGLGIYKSQEVRLDCSLFFLHHSISLSFTGIFPQVPFVETS
jgi:hypothetical protein